jgi:hypothetical protein
MNSLTYDNFPCCVQYLYNILFYTYFTIHNILYFRAARKNRVFVYKYVPMEYKYDTQNLIIFLS